MRTAHAFKRIPSALLSVAAGALLLHSCSVEKEFDLMEDPEEEGIEMILRAGGPGTKTDNSGDSTLWSEGDALSVFHSATGQQNYWLSWFSYFYGNMFTGTVKKLSSTNDWYAVYPYKEENTSPDAIHLTFPAAQVQVGNSNKAHFAGESFPMLGKTTGVSRTEDLSMTLSNVLSAAEFKVTNEDEYTISVKSVTLTAPSSIAGEFTVDMTGDTPVVTAESAAVKTVTLQVDAENEDDLSAMQLAPGETATFYMAVAPFEMHSGDQLKLKVTAEYSHMPGVNQVYYRTITVNSDTQFSSNSIKTVNVHYNMAESETPAAAGADPGLEPGDQPEDGEYLLVYEDGDNSMAFAAFADQKANNYAIPVSVVNGTVISPDGEDLSAYAITIEVALESDGSPMEHPNDEGHYAYNVRNSEGQYIFYSTGGGNIDSSEALQIKDTNTMEIDDETYSYYHTFVQEEDGVQIMSSIATGGNQYLLAYSAANGFYYEEENSGQKLHLYLLGGTVKEKQHLAFDPETVIYDYDAGGDFPEPELTGAQTTVTYTSGNTSVATVDAATGAVTVLSPGSATITARAEADETHYAGTASYTIISNSNTIQTWYKADEVVSGEQYLIVSNGYALRNNDGSLAASEVEVGDGVVFFDAPSTTLWTAATSSSNYTFKNDGKYVYRSSSKLSLSSSSTAWSYDSDAETIKYSSTYSTYYLYYDTSSSAFTISSSSSSTKKAALYTATKPLTAQKLSFEKSNIRWTVGEGEDYAINGSYAFPQEVSGAQTTVTYTSSNESVAVISGSQITVKGIGATTITATAVATDDYKEGSASYTLRIAEPLPGGFTDLGTFNLENDKVYEYLNAAEQQYTDDNYTSVSIVANYTSTASNTNRLDIPAPVTLTWDDASSGTATVTIFSDEALANVVWTQTAASGSTSDEVYNLIPGNTYYCTVEDAGGSLLLKGAFMTEGRRRMLKVGNTAASGDANNFRDLGGLKTADGTKRIKYGWIFRGTNVSAATDDEKLYMVRDLNIGLDNDLRSSDRAQNLVVDGYTVTWVAPNYDPYLNSSNLQNAEKVQQTMQAFIDAAKAGKASYFHCTIGSDRTGYWGLLLEGLLGVSAKDCSMDYELTSFAKNVTSGNRERNGTSSVWALFNDGLTYLNSLDNGGTTLEEKITNYMVQEVGISLEDIQEFKSIVLEDIE